MRRPTLILATLLLLTAALSAQPAPSEQSRFQALDRTIEKAPPEQRIAWNALLAAFTTFRDARVQYEVCLSAALAASACANQRAAEKAHLNDFFLNRVAPQDADGTDPKDTLEARDAALNAAYEQLLAALPESCPVPLRACLLQSTFREIQRDWIRYRDAFVTFATLRSPQVPADHWLILLTSERTTQIAATPPNPR